MTKTLEKSREQQEHLFTEISSLLGTLASPVRLKIIHFLSQSPHSVEQLSIKLNQSIANTSMHLKKMQRENVLKIESLGQKRFYSLAQEEMKDFWEQIQNFNLYHNAQNKINSSEIYQEDLSWPKGLDESIKMIKGRKLTLLDVRPDDEINMIDPTYKKYVIHHSFENLKKMKDSLPTSRPMLIFCRGRLCVLSNESTFQLRKLGFDAYKFDHSWFEISKKLKEI